MSLSGVMGLQSYEPFSRLVKLQQLYMDLQLGVQEDTAQSAQQPFKPLQALTFLSLCMEEPKRNHTSSTPPLSGCSALEELHFYSPSLDASSGATWAASLYVTLPAVEQGGFADLTAVLSNVGNIQHLERLALSTGFQRAPVILGRGAAGLCRALTARGQLNYLDLSGVVLPLSAWSHVFSSDRQLPQLRRFKLFFDFVPAEVPCELPDELLDCSALEQMITCCPAITRLDLSNMSVFMPDVSLLPLLRLRGLADLECPHVMDGAASVGVLACLSTLTRLHVRPSRQGDGLTDNGMLQLTGLKGLQELGLRYPPWTDQRLFPLSIMGGHWQVTLRATKCPSPDVWYQLLLACASTAECQASLDRQLPDIVQQLQDRGHDTAAFELARVLGRAQTRVTEAKLALTEAEGSEAKARARLQEMLAAGGKPYAALWNRPTHESYDDYSD